MSDEMRDDDTPSGHVLTRRDILTLFGATAGAAMLAACVPGGAASPIATAGSGPASPGPTTAGATTAAATDVPACIVKPALTEGPYFVDEKLDRSDIRSDPSDGSVSPGTELLLTFAVSRISGAECVPFEGALVDVWHCDAAGAYSDVIDRGFSTVGRKFLRGYQVADAAGQAAFTTVYPGWYQGRAVHVHFKIRTDAAAAAGLEFTSQLFFDEAVTDAVHAAEPYAAKGRRTLLNEGDGIYQGGGSQLLLAPASTSGRYAATMAIGVLVS